MKMGMLPRRSINVCIFTAPLEYLPKAHAHSLMLTDIVVESSASMSLAKGTSGTLL